jgi:NAD(P)-dependent dehydrogenase (short-subunit alcohol dehydrogenase family)
MNAKNLFDLSGKTALITGGSRGLGLQIAEGAPDSLAVRPFAGRGHRASARRYILEHHEQRNRL